MQHRSNDDLNQDADSALYAKRSPTEQKDLQGRTYSYMSPISSDADDVLEEPQRNFTKQAKQPSMMSLYQENPKIQGSIKKIQRHSNTGSAESESELGDHVAQKERLSSGKRAKKSPKGSDHKSGNGKARATNRQNSVQASGLADRDSDTEKELPIKRANINCRVSTEIDEQIEDKLSNLDKSKAMGASMSIKDDAKDSSEHQFKNADKMFLNISKHRYLGSASFASEKDMEEKPKTWRVKVTPKRKAQALNKKIHDPSVLGKPTKGSLNKPRVRKKEGTSSRKPIPIKCEICSRSIRCKSILARHMLTHTGEKPFKCDECGKHYTSSSNLRIHQMSHSGKMDYDCNMCGQKFTHLPYLKRHLLRHSGEKMHACEHCGKSFIQKYHLLRHILIHTRQMPYVCDKCEMSFNRSDYLKIHMRNVHQIKSSTPCAKLEKHKCEACNKYFANLSSLEIHKRIHTGEKPYSCTVCSREFKQSSHLYSHMVTHSSEKPHACSVCELRFTRKSHLKKHKEKVHSAEGDHQISCLY